MKASRPAETEKPTPSPGPAKPTAAIVKPSGVAKPETPRDDKGQFEKMPKEFRAEFLQNKAELKTLSDAKTQLEAKIRDFEARGKDTEALAAKLTALEKERDELKGHLSASRFETSEQFKKAHEEPFNQAVEVLKSEIPGWQIVDADGNPVRTASFKDFRSIYNMDRPDAKAAATRLFGDDATNVLSAYDQLHRLERTMDIARDTERTNWQKTQSETQANNESAARTFRMTAEKIEKDLVEQNPEWYGERPGDKEHNEMRSEGYNITNLRPSNPEDRAIWWAEVKHRAANFAPAQRQITLLKAEVASLKAKLNGQEDSEPGRTQRPTDTPAGEPEGDWRQEMRDKVPSA